MMLVRTRVQPSDVHGMGLFAVEAVPQGTPVWRIEPGFDSDFAPTNLTVRYVRDDGIVTYLNGTEIFGDNMATGAVSYATRPSGSVGSPAETTWNTFTTNSAALLHAGINVIAAEVHQIDGNSSDIGFNLELNSSGLRNPVDRLPPVLHAETLGPAQVGLWFPADEGLAYVLQGSTSLSS